MGYKEEPVRIDFSLLVGIMLRHWLLILCLCVAGVGAGYARYKSSPKVTRASAVLQIGQQPLNRQDMIQTPEQVKHILAAYLQKHMMENKMGGLSSEISYPSQRSNIVNVNVDGARKPGALRLMLQAMDDVVKDHEGMIAKYVADLRDRAFRLEMDEMNLRETHEKDMQSVAEQDIATQGDIAGMVEAIALLRAKDAAATKDGVRIAAELERMNAYAKRLGQDGAGGKEPLSFAAPKVQTGGDPVVAMLRSQAEIEWLRFSSDMDTKINGSIPEALSKMKNDLDDLDKSKREVAANMTKLQEKMHQAEETRKIRKSSLEDRTKVYEKRVEVLQQQYADIQADMDSLVKTKVLIAPYFLESPVAPSLKKSLALGGGAGLAFGMLLSLLLYKRKKG